MGSWDVRLLSASYSSDESGSVYVELFGKTRDRQSITILCYGFNPYFFILEPTAGLEEQLNKDEEIIKTEHDELLFKGENHKALKVTLKSPWKMIEYKNRWKNIGFQILAADIPFHHRFIYDHDMGSCIKIEGEIIERKYLTDLTVKMDSFENIESFDPNLKILSFDIENSIEHGFIYTICAVVEEKGVIRNCEPLVGAERKIIKDFSDLIQREDPDILTGYNIDNYDIRKIIERAEKNGMKDALPWGRDGGQPRVVSDRFWRVKGRLILDAWWSAKRELRPKQETLNAVSKLVLGETKLDVDPKRMDEEWKNNQKKVLEYCLKDSELALRILLSIGVIRKNMDLSTVSKLPLEDVLTSGSSQLADSLLIRLADRNKVAVPLMGRRDLTSDHIEGGYVHTMNPGLYHWVCILDFKSMYPSIIITNNICFTTLSPEGEIVSPSGSRFLSPEKRVGLLPTILRNLMDERDEIKRKMKSATEDSEIQYLDGLQSAVKILMNTFYGVFASSFYRFTDKNIGASITAFARDNVTSIIREVESENISVIYSDTDSVFIQSPFDNVEESVEFGRSMAERFSKSGETLEFEKLLEPLFSHGRKKRYVGRVAWPNKSDELLVRGYEIRRSDSFDLQSRLLTELFEKILDENQDDAVALVRKTVQDTLSGNVDPSDLVISRTCKGLDAYKNPDRMGNVQAARKLIDMGYKFIPGMKVSWIVTNGKKSPQIVEPYVSGTEFTAKPDYKYYAERLAQTTSRITEVFGWEEKDLMLGSKQSTLFDVAFSSTPKEKQKPNDIEKPKPSFKTGKLDGFAK